MPLIKCPECKKKISDQCESCPNCGYPINKICETGENQSTDIENNAEETPKGKKSFEIKSLIKKWWFWVVVGAVIAAITVTTVILLNRDTKPKFDEDGKPIFTELTNEVYTNAENYTGYHINIKGKVFQVMSDNGSVKGIQIWLDPDTCEQNMMIYYSTDVEVKQGDYIMCSGYIDSVAEYKNAYDATRYAPVVISSDLKKATYIDVMAPTIESIKPNNAKREKYGYSITIDKVEFAKQETRVYVTATNHGKATFNIGDAVIVQKGKQYKTQTNYDADYEELPYGIVKSVSCSGILVFPAMDIADFKLTFNVYSENFDEDFDDFVFEISKKTSTVISNTASTVANTNNTKPVTTVKNRNQEAVVAAINVAKDFFPTHRGFVTSVLLNPSAEEGFDAFTEAETTYAIKNANIDWNKHILTYVKNNMPPDTFCPNDITSLFMNGEGFTNAEISYALNNCGVNWKKKAIEAMWSHWDHDYSVIVTYYDFHDYLSNLGFDNSTIEYALNNTSGYFRGEAVENEQARVKLLFSYGYTREAIIDWYAKDMGYTEAEALVDSCIE